MAELLQWKLSNVLHLKMVRNKLWPCPSTGTNLHSCKKINLGKLCSTEKLPVHSYASYAIVCVLLYENLTT